MKIKLLSTAFALALATTLTPVFAQSGGGNSDGGGQQGVGAVGTVENNAPPSTMVVESRDEHRFTTKRMDRRSHHAPVDRSSPQFSGIDDNHQLQVDHK